MKKVNTKLTYIIETKKAINEKNNVIVIVAAPKNGWGGGGSKFTLKNVEFLLYNVLLTKGFFYCQRNLCFGAHIDTG